MKKRLISILLILVLLIPLCASAYATKADGAEPYNITDDVGLLSDADRQRLEKMAQTVTYKYGIGVYAVILDDYSIFNSDSAYAAAESIYHRYNMGQNSGRDGILLLLSMSEREYGLYYYGDKSAEVFTDSALQGIEDAFLNRFGEDDWAGGFEDYIRECARFLESAAEGKPVKQSPVTLILIFCGVALLIALVATLTIWERMNSVAMETTAHAYISGNLELTEKTDRFTHSTETSRKIERSSSSSGSSSESGGGGSGRSGKF